jgi:hypothetical protein
MVNPSTANALRIGRNVQAPGPSSTKASYEQSAQREKGAWETITLPRKDIQRLHFDLANFYTELEKSSK